MLPDQKPVIPMSSTPVVAGLLMAMLLTCTSCGPSDTLAIGEWQEISQESWDSPRSICFYDEFSGVIIGDSGFVAMSADGGTTWHSQTLPEKVRLQSACYLSGQVCFITGGTVVYSTIDGGMNWTVREVVQDSLALFTAIQSGGDNKLYLLSRDGRVFSAGPAGLSWSLVHDLEGLGYNQIDMSEAPVGFVKQFFANKFYSTLDGGSTWQEKSLPTQWGTGLFFIDAQQGWVTEDFMLSCTIHDSTSVYMTSNGGLDWTVQAQLDEPMLRDLVFVSAREGFALGITRVLYTVNAGESWIKILELDEEDGEYISDLFVLDRDHAWVLTSKGRVLSYSMGEY